MSRDLESYVRRAHAERAHYIAELIASGIVAAAHWIAWGAGRVRRGWKVRGPAPRVPAPKSLASN